MFLLMGDASSVGRWHIDGMNTYRVVPYKGGWAVETIINGESSGLMSYATEREAKEAADRMIARDGEKA